MAFKDRLREEIEYKGLKIKDLSSAIGISNSTFLSYIDARGVLPNVETAVKIAEILGVSVEYLVKEKEEDKLLKKIREESRLIQNYESLSDHDKSVLLTISDAMSKMK